MFDCRSMGTSFESQLSHITIVEIDPKQVSICSHSPPSADSRMAVFTNFNGRSYMWTNYWLASYNNLIPNFTFDCIYAKKSDVTGDSISENPIIMFQILTKFFEILSAYLPLINTCSCEEPMLPLVV